MQITEPDQGNSFKKLGPILGILAVLGFAGVIFGPKLFSSKGGEKKREAAPIAMVRLPPPPVVPTPPPTPPPQEQVREEKMIAQEPVNPDEQKPEPEKAPEQPVGTNNSAQGNDAFGLQGGGTGMKFGSQGSGRSGSRWGWYANQVQSQISEALRKNRKTQNAAFRLEVRIWPDSTGRISKASLASSTGDSALDETIKNEVLNGLQLQDPPPAGMPAPIVMRLTARRPN